MIVADSADSLVRDRARKGRPPRYRLVLPDAFGPPDPVGGSGHGQQVVAERLTTVLNTAAKIAALLEDYAERDADINVEWSAECGGERVEWQNFLYVPQRIWVLRRRLTAFGPELTHPVAVVFRASERQSASSGVGASGSCAAVYALPPEPGAPETDRLSVVGEQELVDSVFANGTRKYYIGYGMWHRTALRAGDPVRLCLGIYTTAQIADISDRVGDRPLARWGEWRRLHDE